MKIQHLKLHHFPATRSARVKWVLAEAVGDDFEVENVDLYGSAQYSAEYLRFNPNHNVPVLEVTWEDGSTQVMLESAAIVAFIADAYPDRKLAPLPGASRERADYLQMLHFASTSMDMMLWQIRVHEHILLPEQRDPRTLARYRGKMETEVEPQLARRLEATEFICGDSFTAADCVVGQSVFWAKGYGLCRDDVFSRYMGSLSQRPAFQRAFDDLDQFTPEVPQGEGLSQRFTG